MTSKPKSKETYNRICSELDLSKHHGLVEANSDALDEHQRHIFEQAKSKLGIDAIFFMKPENGPSVPLVYFRKFESRNPDDIA